jgi:DNA-binding HxlR family transcriptional regulator
VKWNEIATQHCSIARTLSVIGDTWTMLVVRELFNGNRRFAGLLAATEAPPAILSERLSMLEREGVVDKHPYSTRTDRFEYRPTEKGRDLYPILLTLMTWGDRWMADGTPPPVQLRHSDCGHATTPTLTCSACGEPLDPRAVTKLTTMADDIH